MKKVYKQNTDNWYLERIIFLVAGTFVVISVFLIFMGFFGWLYFIFLVGIMLINFALFGYCPMAILLSKNGVKEK